MALIAVAMLAAVVSLARACEPDIGWIIRARLGGREAIALTRASRPLADDMAIIWRTDGAVAVAWESGRAKPVPNRYGVQRFAIRCGYRQWPLFTYFKRNRNHYSKHRVTCRLDGDALWCDVLSSGANPAERRDILVSDDARECLPSEAAGAIGAAVSAGELYLHDPALEVDLSAARDPWVGKREGFYVHLRATAGNAWSGVVGVAPVVGTPEEEPFTLEHMDATSWVFASEWKPSRRATIRVRADDSIEVVEEGVARTV